MDTKEHESDGVFVRLSRSWREWLFYFLLAVPGILLPRFDHWNVNRVRFNLGWPIPGMDILIRVDQQGVSDTLFQPDLLPVMAIIWICSARYLWKARLYLNSRQTWLSSFGRGLLASLYLLLVLWFFAGSVELIWNWLTITMNLTEVEQAYRFGRYWLPFLWLLGALTTVILLYVDSLQRRGALRVMYVIFASCCCYGFWSLTPSLVRQLSFFDESIRCFQEELAKQ